MTICRAWGKGCSSPLSPSGLLFLGATPGIPLRMHHEARAIYTFGSIVTVLLGMFFATAVADCLISAQSRTVAEFLALNPLMHEVAVLFQICSEVMSSLGNHSSWLHSFK